MIQIKPHSTQVSKLLCLFALSALTVQASVLPVDLPAPDPDDKGRSDQPVKVYILSGQSNMLGFARVEGAEPSYTHVFLSGDPSVDQTKQFAIIKQKVAMAPVGIYQSGDKDAARGGGGDHIIRDALDLEFGPRETGAVALDMKTDSKRHRLLSSWRGGCSGSQMFHCSSPR